MKKIEVELEGTGEGLLMHSAQNMVQKDITKNPTRQYDIKKDAEEVAYRNSNGELYIPSRCLKACILNASSWYKFGKKSAKPIIAGCTRILPFSGDEIVLTDLKNKVLKEYKVDTRPVIIQRARIIRARPLIKDWKIKFYIMYNEQMIGNTQIIQQILEEAGQRIGLLDNRPQRYGENGTFKLNKFLPEK